MRRGPGRAMLAHIAVIAWACSATPASAIDPFAWEPIPEHQLKQSESLVEPDAHAEVIFHHEWVTDQFTDAGIAQVREIYERVKVLTARGAQMYSSFSIDYPQKGGRVTDIRARTILANGTIVPLDRGAVIDDAVVRKRREVIHRKSFALPRVEPGCLVEIRYRLDLNDASFTSQTFHFQDRIPIQKIVYHVRPVYAEGWHVRTQMFHANVTQSPKRVNGYHEFVAMNQPAYADEPDGPPELQRRAWMIMYYSQEDLRAPEVYWPRQGRKLAGEYETTCRPDADAKRLAAELTATATRDADKVSALARWMGANFRLVRSTSPESLKAARLRVVDTGRDALEQRGGTSLDANLAFATLAKAAGLDVRLVRVPSREYFFFEPNVMMHPAFVPHVQVGVRIDGTWRCHDLGHRYLPTDMLTWDRESQLGLLCDRDSSRFIVTGVAEPERSALVRVARLALDESGTVEGDLMLAISGHANSVWREAFDAASVAELDSTLHRQMRHDSGLELSKVEVLNGSEPREPLRIRCHMKVREHATVTGKRILVEPAVFQARAPARFTAGDRASPVCFDHAWVEADTILLRLPAGWVPEIMESPKPIQVSGAADFQTQLELGADGNEIRFTRNFRFGESGALLFGVAEYSVLKQLFDLIHDRDRTSLTLTRKDAQP